MPMFFVVTEITRPCGPPLKMMFDSFGYSRFSAAWGSQIQLRGFAKSMRQHAFYFRAFWFAKSQAAGFAF